MTNINTLMAYAKAEEWEKVDAKIPEAVKKPETIRWAYQVGILDGNRNIRDLAVTVLQNAKIDDTTFDENIRSLLYIKMKGDKNPYVQYRCASTLAHHNPNNAERKLAKQLLSKALKDPGYVDIAKQDLDLLK